MPMPGGSDLHIDQALTSISVRYTVDKAEFIAEDIFPSLPVEKRSDLYRKYSKSDWRRTDARKRAPGTESAGIGWKVGNDSYYADVYAAHVDIDDQTRANADSNWNLDKDATELVTSHLLQQKDQLWASTFFASGIWATEYTGVAAGPTGTQFLQWDQSASDPLRNFTAWSSTFHLLTGKKINRLVLGTDVWTALANHPAILDRIKYTQKGVITEDLVASFFGVEKLRVARASKAAGAEIPDADAQDAAATYSYICNPKAMLAGFAPPSATLASPSMGYTFNWKGYGAGNKQGLTFNRIPMRHLRSERIEGEAAYVMKVVSPDCGVFFNATVS